jgi:hypothetical protein
MSSKRTKPCTIVSTKNNATRPGSLIKLDALDSNSSAPLSPTTKSVQEYVSEITSSWNKTVAGIFETGRKLIEAKASLEHGQFGQMVRDELPFD